MSDDDSDMPRFGPLAGVRVVDLTMALAGAFVTMLLADCGAEVIKVESLQHYSSATKGPREPPRGDDARSMAARRDYPDSDPGEDPWNRLSWFNSQARNKRDVTLDLTRAKGRELFLRLIDISDALVENNRAGTLEHLGIGAEVLLERNPRLVILRMPPLGLSGPDAATAGFGWHFEELSGFGAVQGYADGQRVGSIFMDGASGPSGASALLMGLLQRRRTGRGCVIEMSQLESLVHHIGDLVMDAAMNHRVPPPRGNRDPDFAPQGVYPCLGEDEWLALSIRNTREWRALRQVLGDPALLRPEALEETTARHAAHDQIDGVISAWTVTRTKEDAFHALQAMNIPAGPVLDEADAFGDPQLQERGFFEVLSHRSAGTHFHPGVNFRLSSAPPQLWRAAPVLGQDNAYVYRELLGLSAAEYADLVDEGHVGSRYV
jgi:crotonobetainyl-CoA:carnitine CoA-transferase CaiB-like acyl-CoA transferase